MVPRVRRRALGTLRHVARRPPLGVHHHAERGQEGRERQERGEEEPADQEEQAKGNRERHPQDGRDAGNQDVGRQSVRHVA